MVFQASTFAQNLNLIPANKDKIYLVLVWDAINI